MRLLLPLLLSLSLLSVPGCAIKENPSKQYYYSPYAVAIIMMAEVVDKYEDDPTVYDGVNFPLFCGFVFVHPEKNTFEFVPATDLPIKWVKKHMKQVAAEGGVTPGPLPGFREIVPFSDEEFFISFYRWLSYWHLGAKSTVVDDQGVPERTPQFKRQCPFDSTVDPPVECGYERRNLEDLLIQ